MLTHREFEKLRLSQFVDASEITELSEWEYLDREWIGEAIGFTEWLRPQSSPHQLGSIALDLEVLPTEVSEACLSRIGLPLRPHMTVAQLVSLLGEPLRTLSFVEDRATYQFRIRDLDAYDLSCTVLGDGGLSYLVVTVPHGGA
jgi:hypothetical protein